ncbi:MAG: substrate-binding domain-containing protein [Blautia sp.]|nr:substrate-binding domain-containing protein [Blautia sp.]
MKKSLILLAAALSAATLTGCTKEKLQELVAPVVAEVLAQQEEEAAAHNQEEEAADIPIIPEIDTNIRIHPGSRIAVVSKTVKGEFWSLVQKGMKQAIKDINDAYGFSKDEQIRMTFEGADDEQDVNTQINTLDAVIAENPDVLCLSASDMDSCLAQLEAAQENGIPVVAFDSNVSESDMICAFRASDNRRVGAIGAYRLSAAIGKMGKVAIFSAQSKTQSVQDRIQGFMDQIKGYGDIEVVETVFIDEVENMEEAMDQVLADYPTLAGVFCTNADISDMYLAMEKDETRDSVAMVGVDATRKQQEAVRDGTEVGVVSQHPFAIGYHTIWAAAQASGPHRQLKDIPREILIAPVWIDASNIDNEAYQEYLY